MQRWLVLALLSVLILSGLVGCSQRIRLHNPTVSIDGWWDVDYARNACSMAAGGGHRCINDPSDMAREVEKDFLSAFQENPACAGVSIVNDFHDPDKDSATTKSNDAKWSLSFNVAIKDGELKLADSEWQIIDSATLHDYADGDLRNFSQASTRVCTVVTGKGGELQ
jgi:hypothetical protein